MSSEYSLLIVLLAIYIIECFILTDKYSIVFYSHYFGDWKYRFSDTLPDLRAYKVFFANPIPVGRYFPCHQLPVALSPAGFFRFSDIPEGKNYYTFDETEKISYNDKSIFINDTLFIRLHSQSGAKFIAEKISILQKSVYSAREKLIFEMINSLFNEQKTRESIDQYQGKTVVLRFISFLLFILFFPVLPLVLFLKLFNEIWLFLFLFMILFLVIILTVYFLTHKKIFPRGRGERWQNIFVMLLSPPLAVRSADILSKDIFSYNHPLPVARYLLGRDKFIALSSELIRNIVYSVNKDQNDTEKDILSWYNNLQLKIITDLLKRDSISLEMILKAPIKESEDISGYCPRCHTQYRHQTEDCVDCNITLNKYEK